MEIQRLFPGDDTRAVALLCAEVQALHATADPARYKQPGRKFIAETTRWFDSIVTDFDRFVLLGTVEGEPVAYASAVLITRAEDMYLWGRVTLYVDQFGVAENQRGKGYGRAMMDELIEIGRSNDVQGIALDVQAFNAGAVEFYRRCGFDVARYRMALSMEDRDV